MNPSLSRSCQVFGGSIGKTGTHPGTMSKIDLFFLALFSQFVLSSEEYDSSPKLLRRGLHSHDLSATRVLIS